MARGVQDIEGAFNGLAHLDQWADDPYAHGSYAGFGPGQYTAYWGYLNGGVESGERAARQVTRSLR